MPADEEPPSQEELDGEPMVCSDLCVNHLKIILVMAGLMIFSFIFATSLDYLQIPTLRPEDLLNSSR